MRKFVASAVVLAVLPMSVLNPIGRAAFLGYYLGVMAMWLLFVLAGRSAAARSLTET
jgi:hypothetical protein